MHRQWLKAMFQSNMCSILVHLLAVGLYVNVYVNDCIVM